MTNPPISKHEEALQLHAEALERVHAPACGDASVEAYRQVIQAARNELPQQLPFGFAKQLAASVENHQRQARQDWWLTLLAISALILVGLFTSADVLIQTTQRLFDQRSALTLLPWRLLTLAGFAMAVIAATDRWLLQKRR